MYRWLLLLVIFIAALTGLAVGVLNPDPVTLDLGVGTPTFPLGAMVLLVFGGGVVVGLVLFWVLFDLPARLTRRLQPKSDQGINSPSANG